MKGPYLLTNVDDKYVQTNLSETARGGAASYFLEV